MVSEQRFRPNRMRLLQNFLPEKQGVAVWTEFLRTGHVCTPFCQHWVIKDHCKAQKAHCRCRREPLRLASDTIRLCAHDGTKVLTCLVGISSTETVGLALAVQDKHAEVQLQQCNSGNPPS